MAGASTSPSLPWWFTSPIWRWTWGFSRNPWWRNLLCNLLSWLTSWRCWPVNDGRTLQVRGTRSIFRLLYLLPPVHSVSPTQLIWQHAKNHHQLQIRKLINHRPDSFNWVISSIHWAGGCGMTKFLPLEPHSTVEYIDPTPPWNISSPMISLDITCSKECSKDILTSMKATESETPFNWHWRIHCKTVSQEPYPEQHFQTTPGSKPSSFFLGGFLLHHYPKNSPLGQNPKDQVANDLPTYWNPQTRSSPPKKVLAFLWPGLFTISSSAYSKSLHNPKIQDQWFGSLGKSCVVQDQGFRTTHDTGCQSPPGLWPIFSREIPN